MASLTATGFCRAYLSAMIWFMPHVLPASRDRWHARGYGEPLRLLLRYSGTRQRARRVSRMAQPRRCLTAREPSLGDVVALVDVRTGSRTEITPGRRGLLRIGAHVPPEPTTSGDLTSLRLLLLADLVARTAEVQGVQSAVAVVFARTVPQQLTEFERAATWLGIHPPATRITLPQSEQSPGGPLDVHVTTGAADFGAAGIVLRCGALGVDADAVRADDNMLALRLALLCVPHAQDAKLAGTDLASAIDKLANSRELVARWAESPSRPMPDRIAGALRAAFDDLDTKLAIRLLRDVVDDPGIAPGAKFEAFAFADRILGLELAREIGRFAS
jgi:hypothetical protein